MATEVSEGRLTTDGIDEKKLSSHLYVPQTSEVDLFIRTSGEMRLSNFMLWQLSYAELYVTKTLWPDFRKRHLHEAFEEYESRQRRFGSR